MQDWTRRKLMAIDIFRPLIVVESVARKRGARVVPKESSALMWALYVMGFMWLWKRHFMERTTVTIWRRIYMPRAVRDDQRRRARVIAHELVHVEDWERFGPVGFVVRYMFPQWVAILAVLAVLAPFFGAVWWVALLGLSAALPWPSARRRDMEADAYAMSEAWRELSGDEPSYLDGYLRKFTGPAYYWMERDGRWVMSWLQELDEDLSSGEFWSRRPIYSDIRDAMAEAALI